MCILPGATPACGPFFPNQVITEGDNRILSMPAGDFADEMNRLRPGGEPAFKAVFAAKMNAYEQSADVDLHELDAALKDAATPDDRRQALLAAYGDVRRQISEYSKSAADDREKGTDPVKPMSLQLQIPAGIPAEFGDYLRGLILFEQGKNPEARATWLTIVEARADHRAHRGAWAAFMIGRSYLKDDPAAAVHWFQTAREMIDDQNKADPLGLAAASFGLEGRAELNAGHARRAIDAYFRQYESGDPSAVDSLKVCGRLAFKSDAAELAAMAADPVCRRVLTALIVSHGGRWSLMDAKEWKVVPKWLDAVEAAAATDVAGADRLAWAAYSAGEFKAAQRWADRADQKSVVTQWVRAKLLLRAGKSAESAGVLGAIVRSFPATTDMTDRFDPDPNRHDRDELVAIPRLVADDMALLNLARGQYVDSLRLLMRTDRWMDAAYVAERVLTVDELKAYVDQSAPEVSGPKDPVEKPWHGSGQDLRHLLARRLTRAGRWKEARPYYPADLRPKLDDYINAIRDGHDAKRPKADRAKSFLAAARLAHDSGMELLGYELAPDFACYRGDFEDEDAHHQRGGKDKIVGPSTDELARFKASMPPDDRRYQYRYVALDHAWDAVQLMPDDTDELAKTLCETAGWVSNKDPKAADKFYKALVRRCPSTELGKQAEKLHWFPKTPA